MRMYLVIFAFLLFVFLLSGCEELDQIKKQVQEVCNTDGVIQAPELCDDKNDNPLDMCDQCFPTYCGDNQVNNEPYNFNRSIEQCDNVDQSLADQQCTDNGFLTPCRRDICQCSGIAPTKVVCNQNNVLDPGEECDQGPKGDSTCTPDCTLTYCGDEKVQAPNGKDLNNKQPGFNEFCDAGKDPFNLTDPVARNAHAFCQAATGNPDSLCLGCRCTDPKTPESCAWGAFAAIFGPVGPLPPGAVCQNDCNLIGPGWVCNNVNCVCQPPPPPPDPTCVENSFSVGFGGAPLVKPGAVCKDDCKDIIFAPPDVFCDPADCICKIKEDPITCGDNTFDTMFGGKSSWKKGDACKDDCKEMITSFAKAFGGSEADAAKAGENVYCDVNTCECKEKVIDDKTISCAKNERDVLQGLQPVLPGEGKTCKDDCKINFETDSAYCDLETCVCQRRPVTPRCGDGYLSSQWVGGGGLEECDTGGRRGYATVPDTCPPPKVCSMEGETACKCVLIDEVIPDACPQGTGTSSSCYNQCYPNEACEAVTYTKRTETPCYSCVPKCPPGLFLNPAACQAYYGLPCAPAMRGCYAPVNPEQDDTIGSLPGGQVVQGGAQEEVIQGGSGQDYVPQPLNCEDECAERGRTTSQPNYGSYILGVLNQYTCVSGATIQIPGVLNLRGPAGDTCTCYSTSNPSVNVDTTSPVCQTACGPVQCAQSADCSCGEGCTRHVTCNWGGWEQIGELTFTPRVAAAAQEASQE